MDGPVDLNVPSVAYRCVGHEPKSSIPASIGVLTGYMRCIVYPMMHGIIPGFVDEFAVVIG